MTFVAGEVSANTIVSGVKFLDEICNVCAASLGRHLPPAIEDTEYRPLALFETCGRMSVDTGPISPCKSALSIVLDFV
jgi:hypothetical protein